MADAIVVYDVNINTQNAEKTIKMLGKQIAEIGTAITSAFQVGAIGSFATESVAVYERIVDTQNEMTKATSKGNIGLWDTVTVAKDVINAIKAITSVKWDDIAATIYVNAMTVKETAAKAIATVAECIHAKAINETAKAKLQAVGASELLTNGLLMGIVAIVALVANADNLSTGMKVLTAILIGLVAVFGVLKVASIITGSTMLLAFAPVLIPILAIAAAIAAVVAIVSLFSSKSDLQMRAEADKKALEEMNGELDETRTKLEDLSAVNKQAADELKRLSEAGDTKNISAMKAQAEELNKTLGDGAVTINDSTGAIMLYGKELQQGSKELESLIALKEADNAVSELQGKINEANAEKAEAEAALEQERLGILQLTNGEKQALNDKIKESTAIIDENNAALTGALEIQEQERLAAVAAREERAIELEEGQGYALAKQQLNEQMAFDQMSYQEKIASLRVSDFETEQEYINAVADIEQQRRDALTEHQKAIEDATRSHADVLFGLNEEGLYSNTKTVEELNTIWQKNQEDMANYQTNLQALTNAGFTELAGEFENGGVAMGGSLANTMEALQGLSRDEWLKIQQNWRENGGKLSSDFASTYAGINLEAGFAMLELADTTKNGAKQAADLGAEEVGLFKDGVTAGYDLAIEESLVKSEELKETSKQVATDAADAFKAGFEEQHDTMKSNAISAGQMFMTGLRDGLDQNKWGPINKAREIAYEITKTIRKAWSIASPSKVAKSMGGYFSEGIAEGIDSERQKAVNSAESLANGVVNVGKNLMRSSTITNNFAPQYAMAGAGVNIDYNMLAAAMANVNIKMDSVTVGKLVEPSVSRVQANRITNKF